MNRTVKVALSLCTLSAASLPSADAVAIEPGTAAAQYNKFTGEMFTDLGTNIGALAFGTDIGEFDFSMAKPIGPVLPTPFAPTTLLYFVGEPVALPTGRFYLGAILPPGLDGSDIIFSYYPLAGEGVLSPVQVIAEPSSSYLALPVGVGILLLARRHPRMSGRQLWGGGAARNCGQTFDTLTVSK